MPTGPRLQCAAMTSALAFVATAVASLHAEATLVRFTRTRRPHQLAWTVALAMFALASAALAAGVSTGWDRPTFRVFYLLGAVLDVPWLALGTVHLLAGRTTARRAQSGVVFFSGLAAGVVLTAPMRGHVGGPAIPVGSHVFGALPRVFAAVGSGAGALVVLGGAGLSAWRAARRGGDRKVALGNAPIALGTLVLSAGGVLQGTLGHDRAFATTLAGGIVVIYAGFLVTSQAARGSLAARSAPEPLVLRGRRGEARAG